MTVIEWAIANPWTAAASVVTAVLLTVVALSAAKKRRKKRWQLLRKTGNERDWKTTVYNPKELRGRSKKH